MRIRSDILQFLHELTKHAEKIFEIKNDANLEDLIEIIASRYSNKEYQYLYTSED